MAGVTVTGQTKAVDIRFVASPGLPDVVGIAEKLFSEAMAFCACKIGAANGAVGDCTAVVDLLRQCDRTAHAYCIYGMAKSVATSLGAMDENIKSVYVYDYDATPEDLCFDMSDPSAPMVHLIIWTERKTAALSALIAALDRALACVYADVLDRPQIKSLLDVQMIDNEDVDSCKGYGALLSSLHHRPMQIWAR